MTKMKPANDQPIIKRRITLLRTLSKPAEAISAMVQLLEMSPTDAEAWAELSDMYMDEVMYPQAIFCLEEVLLITPNAWNVSLIFDLAFMASLSALAHSPRSTRA